MSTTTIRAYFIQCITNMHVGSGDANYGVVDKLVQRDPVTDFPTIHASSMKGALREHFESLWGKGTEKINGIFGKEGQESQSGDFKFFGADLAALPVRSNYKQFSLAVCPELVEVVNSKSNMLMGKAVFSLVGDFDRLFCQKSPAYDVYFEDEKFGISNHQPLLNCTGINGFDDRYAVAENSKFSGFAKNLPVIARNQLENGISKNLWYEEVVPHQTVFITFIAATDKYLNDFESELLKEGNTVQIGGNASIGYGLCKFNKISFK